METGADLTEEAAMFRWTELALEVARAKSAGGNPKGDRAMADLSPLITQTARRIHAAHASLRRQRALDFVAMSPALVWRKIEKFVEWYDRELTPETRASPTKDFFAAWCYVELRYRYLDAGREQGDERKVRSLNPAASIAGRLAGGDVVTEDDEPTADFDLSPDEVDRIKAWDPLDAVILFCLTGQWDKVPADVWRGWLEQLSLTEPFPPDTFLRSPKTKKRAVLADLLNVSRDVIYQRWLRLKVRLQGNAPATALE
jgi:hypothetical protein